MTIKNHTSHTLTVHGRDVNPTEIDPGMEMRIYRRMFDCIGIHSDIGSCIITVSYGEKIIKSFGLDIEEKGKNIIVVA